MLPAFSIEEPEMSLASAPLAASGAAQPGEVSQQEFLQHINAMQQHYREIDPTVGQSIKAYLLPAHLTIALPHASADAGTKPAVPQAQQSPGLSAPKESAERTAPMLARLVTIGTPAPAAQLMSAALEDQHQRLRALVDHHRGALLHAVAAARDLKSTQTFVQQMNAMREATKADHRGRIDAMFASFTAIGTAHPAARPVILDTGNKVATFGAGVAAGAAHVIATVTSAVAAGGSAIANAADTVGKWGSETAHKVEHFFSSLF
jgi:hypothetical protein